MATFARESAPKVRNGKTQRKNRTHLTPHYSQTRQPFPIIDRQRPGEGYRHLITVKQLKQFIELLPDWEELSRGLDAIVLAPGNSRSMGWYRRGIVAIRAWEHRVEQNWHVDFIREHLEPLERLGIEFDLIYDDPDAPLDLDYRVCRFTEVSARGFQLMHVFLHELGHHHDRMTTKTKSWCGRGESYAEGYAHKYAERIWDSYFNVFGF